MGWDIKVPETSCPYYLSRFIHYSCSNWINKTGNCNEEKCPVKVGISQCSNELYKLADEVANGMGKIANEDVTEWAENLSENLSQLKD